MEGLVDAVVGGLQMFQPQRKVCLSVTECLVDMCGLCVDIG